MLFPHEDNVDVITRFNIGHRGWRVVSLFSILVIGGGGFWSLMMVRWYVLIMKITVFKVSFTCHRGLISPLALLGFATSHQHRIVSVMSQWWVWANVKVADNMFKRQSNVTRSDCFIAMSRTRWICLNCLNIWTRASKVFKMADV